MCVLHNSAGLICYLKVQENLFSPLQFCDMIHLKASLYCVKWTCLLSHMCLCDFRTVRCILVCHVSEVACLLQFHFYESFSFVDWSTFWFCTGLQFRAWHSPLVQGCALNHEYQNYSYGSSGIMLTHSACTQCELHIILGARFAYLVFWLGNRVDEAGIGFW